MRREGLYFHQVIEQLRDGNGYRFSHGSLEGHFYKAPFPSQELHTNRDGAKSAITFWNNGVNASPTLLLYDFYDPVWWIETDDPVWWIETSDSP